MRQLLVESLLLSLAGGAAGLLVAAWSDDLLVRLMSTGSSPLELSTTPDVRVLLFALAVSCLTGIVFGLIPALQSTRPDVAATLKESAGAVIGGGQFGYAKRWWWHRSFFLCCC